MATGSRQQRDPPRGSIAVGEADNDEPSGLVTKIYGRERLVFSRQQICDDLLKSLPKLHAALRSNPSRNERVWRRTSSAGSSVNTFELVGMPPDDGGSDGSEVQYAVAASVKLKCHMNEVLNVLVSQTSSDYEATMEALNGKRFVGGELLYRERCRLLHNDGSKNESQALLGVQMAALRPSWRVRLTPSHLCHPEHSSTQRLCFSSLTHRYPGSDRAVHVMKTLPTRIHDQIIPRGFRSALRQHIDHLGIAFDIESRAVDADKGVAQRMVTRIFAHAYVAAPTLENSIGYSPALDDRRGRPRSFTSPDDWENRGPSVVNPEAKYVVELLTHQLNEIERVIRRRRFGFQSFMYFQPPSTSVAGQSSFSQLRSMCKICLKCFSLFRREFYCQICGHLVCGECSQLYDVEARVGGVRKNRVCLNCVVRVDSCIFAEEDIVAALGPTVVPLKRSSQWSQDFESDEFGCESIGGDIRTASESSDASHIEDEDDELAIQLYSKDYIECTEGLVQLGQILLDSSRANRARCRSRGKSGARRKKSVTKESVHTQLERYVNYALRDSQRRFPARSLKTADLVHDYRYTFDAVRTTYEGHPLPPTPSPAREARRLHHIQASGILEPEYDHGALDLLAQVAAERLNCPVGFISLVDETLFHSVGTYPSRNVGLQTPRAESMCAHTVYVDKPLVIKNAQADLRFAQLPVVRDFGIRFYAGFPIRAPDGSIVASLCTSDRVPHNNISAADYAIMQTLAGIAGDIVAPRDRVISIPYQPRQRGNSNCRMRCRSRSRSRSRGRKEPTITTVSAFRQIEADGLQLDSILSTR